MSIPIGTRLDTYEIVAPLGSGGMGEVYRARDTKLDRQYDVMPDGQRFLMVRPVGAGRQGRMILVRNAFGRLGPGAPR